MLAPISKGQEKLSTYESGIEPTGDDWLQFEQLGAGPSFHTINLNFHFLWWETDKLQTTSYRMQ